MPKGLRRGIHISDVRAFKECRRRWQFQSPLRMNLEPKIPDKNLKVGSLVHSALATYYHPDNVQKRSTILIIEAYKEGVFKFLDSLEKQKAEDPFFRMSEEDEEDLVNEVALGQTMLEHYSLWAPKYDLDFDVVLPPEVRLEIALPIIPGEYVYFEGTADMYIYIPKGELQGYWLVEHKTASQFPDSNSLLLDEQCLAYIWAGQTLPNPPRGTLYNFLRKKAPANPRRLQNGTISTAVNQDTSFDWWKYQMRGMDEEMKVYQNFLYGLYVKPNPFFDRSYIERTVRQLQVFSNQLMEVITEMLDPATSCYPASNWFKCRGCPFRGPCTSVQSGIDPQPLLDTNFRVREARWADVSPWEE